MTRKSLDVGVIHVLLKGNDLAKDAKYENG